MLNSLRWPLAYVVSILAVNYGFTQVPLVPLLGDMWPPMSLLVGFIFVIRDFTQRQVGHWIWAYMALGGLLSYIMADPFVAVASVTAFMVSEAVDWSIYTFTGKTLSQRVLLSSAVSTPFDSVIFLGMIGHLSVVGVLLMVASKMVGALIVWWIVRRQEIKEYLLTTVLDGPPTPEDYQS